MGYSATQIMKWKPSSYTVLEPDPVVYNRAVEWAKDYSNVTVLQQAWPDTTGLFKYDSFFFDPYLEGDLSDVTINNCAVTYFVVECVKKLARKRTRFSFYCSSQGNDMHDWGRNLYSVLESLPEGHSSGSTSNHMMQRFPIIVTIVRLVGYIYQSSCGSVIEQLPSKQSVVGSSPT